MRSLLGWRDWWATKIREVPQNIPDMTPIRLHDPTPCQLLRTDIGKRGTYAFASKTPTPLTNDAATT